MGPGNALVTLTIFSDFQCPYCAKLARTLRQDVLPREAGSVRVVFRYFPLSMHTWAEAAAKAEVCVSQQSPDLFWKVHDFLFENQRYLNRDSVVAKILEQAKGIDKGRFNYCLNDKQTASIIERDVALGTENGVVGTPTIFVNGERVNVASEPEQIRSLIREASAKSAMETRVSR